MIITARNRAVAGGMEKTLTEACFQKRKYDP